MVPVYLEKIYRNQTQGSREDSHSTYRDQGSRLILRLVHDEGRVEIIRMHVHCSANAHWT